MAYGFLLADRDRIIMNEQPKAWTYGPFKKKL